eukprot:CAMPEP_0174385938 /NCGR_PEP_ID=MMETSP0811_2-20130205/126941_1 /TAXON_ID=73025 ORGANISM="Eutreptiella gymnastica-like, Strain CCMP1594" /NCGR_SAMPLE_ID=MMETSP0811_2 /ASSEMBLY_ACC=CAM_ASM_000667 /LENGTH=139 /DNA_ID=CAMNT_0015540439 /DNA_START=1322 /DNA_END=1742 /DNA_ORIENTATION=+
MPLKDANLIRFEIELRELPLALRPRQHLKVNSIGGPLVQNGLQPVQLVVPARCQCPTFVQQRLACLLLCLPPKHQCSPHKSHVICLTVQCAVYPAVAMGAAMRMATGVLLQQSNALAAAASAQAADAPITPPPTTMQSY